MVAIKERCEGLPVVVLDASQKMPDLEHVLLVRPEDLVHEISEPEEGAAVARRPVEEAPLDLARAVEELL